MKINLLFIVFLAGVFFACQTREEHAALDTPTSGNLHVVADEGLKPLLEHQAYTFMKVYNSAKIAISYADEKAILNALYYDSCKTIALNRNLSEAEEKWFKEANITINKSFICKSGIVLITNKEYPDSVISISEMKKILKGDTSVLFNSKVIFESENSTAAYFFRDSLLLSKSFAKNCFATKDVFSLMQKLTSNKNAIGVIDYNRISDSDDSLSKFIKKNYKVLAVSRLTGQTGYYPDQSNLQTEDYPLTRKIYLMRRGQDFSLAAGFITFVAGPTGQIMLLKTGFAPWRQPERVISVDLSPI